MTRTVKAKDTSVSQVKKTVARTVTKCEEDMYIQFAGHEWKITDLADKIKNTYVADGHKISAIKKLTVYVKPEEKKAYYVVNETETGCVEF